MEPLLRLLLIPLTIPLLFPGVHGDSCSSYSFSGNRVYHDCMDLPYLNSFLHWNYDSLSHTVSIAFRHSGASPNRWAAWALNPTRRGMISAQALVAFQQSNGTMAAYTTQITDLQPSVQPADLSFPVVNLAASFAGNDIIIFGTLLLGNLNGSLHQLWQEGPLSDGSPQPHNQYGANLQSVGTIDFQSGTTTSASGNSSNSVQPVRNIHGVLNAVGWGTLLPIGAITARYMRVFHSADPAWFYLHVSCQISGYLLGVSGWAIGLHLGSQSAGTAHPTHRAIGIAIFCLATIQLSALLLRPKKDNKHRLLWNIQHHSIGYTIILLSIVNIFKGLNILKPEHQWRRAYTAVVAILALAAAVLEVYTWIVVLRRKKSIREENAAAIRMQQTGFNGYRGRI